MASEITPDGRVIAPFNIQAPAPAIDLRGFRWTTVTDPSAPLQGHPDADQHDENQQDVLVASASSLSHRGPGGAPDDNQNQTKLPDVLARQLNITTGVITDPLPSFPLTAFQSSYAGNGFNMLFRPLAANMATKDNVTDKMTLPFGPGDKGDNILQLNLTREQLTFGATIGDVPNRGLVQNGQETIQLGGLPYLQTVQDVTDAGTGLGTKLKPDPIHFETGVWLTVPPSTFPQTDASICRMGSIPHGTTILAQALAPKQGSGRFGGLSGRPSFDELNTTPFSIGNLADRKNGAFPSMDATRTDTARIPQNLGPFNEKTGTGAITTKIIKNPNLVLSRALDGLTVRDTVTFEVSTDAKSSSMPTGGGGTSNISFLMGQNGVPNAHIASMSCKYWIETVEYSVTLPASAFKDRNPIRMRPTMPQNSTAPTPEFEITPPAKLPTTQQTFTVTGTQIQYSQNVTMNFFGLSWPHISVATLVPTNPQPFKMT